MRPGLQPATSVWWTRATSWWHSGMGPRRARGRRWSEPWIRARKFTSSLRLPWADMPVAVAVHVRYFARLREQAGTESETIELAPGSTVTDAYDVVKRAHPGLEPNRDTVRPALNMEFADWDAVVGEGDELAFIPPVSGEWKP